MERNKDRSLTCRHLRAWSRSCGLLEGEEHFCPQTDRAGEDKFGLVSIRDIAFSIIFPSDRDRIRRISTTSYDMSKDHGLISRL